MEITINIPVTVDIESLVEDIRDIQSEEPECMETEADIAAYITEEIRDQIDTLIWNEEVNLNEVIDAVLVETGNKDEDR